MQPFTFYLDWIISGQFAGLCWALDRGLYAQAGLDVELRPWVEDGRSIIQKVLDGGICAGSSEDNLIARASAAGQEVKALAVMLQESPLVLMTKTDSSIYSLADLPGKRVAMHVDGIHILEAALALHGIDQSKLDLVVVHFDLDNLLQDRYDAVQGYATTEPITLAGLGVPVRLIPVRHPKLHPYAQVFFAGQTTLTQQPELIRAFLAASFEGWRQALTQPDEATQLIINMSAEPADFATERQILEQIFIYASGQAGLTHFGTLDLIRWGHNLESYARFGITPRLLALDEVVDDRFLQEVYG